MSDVERPARSRAPIRQLLAYLAPHRGALLLAAAVSLPGSATSLAQPLLVRRALDAVAGGGGVATAVGVLVVVLVLSAVLDGVQRYLLQRTAEGVVLGARRRLIATLLRLPIAEFDARRTGDLISRVGSDTTLLRAVVTGGMIDLVGGVLVAGGALVLMAMIDLPLLGVTVLALTIGVGSVVAVSGRIQRLTKVAQAAVGAMTASVDRALNAVRTIRAAGAEDREADDVGRSALAAYEAGLGVARLEAVVRPAAGAAAQAAFLTVLGVGGARVASGSIAISDLIAFGLYLFLLMQPIGQAFNAFASLQVGLGALSRIEEVRLLATEEQLDAARLAAVPATAATVLATGPLTANGTGPANGTDPANGTLTANGADPAAGPDPVYGTGPAAGVGGGGPALLEFDGVDFDYPDGTRVLRGVSLAVHAGQRVALVGPSGAGKSTLLALAERFYDPTGGSIRLAGVDVAGLSRAAVRSRLGYVEQDAPALAGSLRDNLLLASPQASDTELLRVLAAVNLTALVERSPAGLDTQVGDSGVLLSGGERQRLALARVLLTAPPLMLLDEPTASLDGRNEAALAAAIDAVAVDRSLLVVAHRLATVRHADLIVVLDAGRVVATGRHDDLVDSSPLYRELAAHQLLL